MDIIVKELCKSYGKKKVLSDFSECFRDGETTCIMGASGCGKTTLLSILLGLEQADSGTVDGVPYGSLAAVFQEDRLCENRSAVSNVKLVLKGQTREGKAENAMAQIGLGDSLHKPVREFSGGMKRRVAILRALLSESSCVMMDEPLKGLDEETRRVTAAYIKENTKGKTLIVITHDEEETTLLQADKIVRLGVVNPGKTY